MVDSTIVKAIDFSFLNSSEEFVQMIQRTRVHGLVYEFRAVLFHHLPIEVLDLLFVRDILDIAIAAVVAPNGRTNRAPILGRKAGLIIRTHLFNDDRTGLFAVEDR